MNGQFAICDLNIADEEVASRIGNCAGVEITTAKGDIGAWDGFFSFEAERRGARRVVAVDPAAWREDQPENEWGSKAGFELARRVLGSHVEDLELDLVSISPATVQTFATDGEPVDVYEIHLTGKSRFDTTDLWMAAYHRNSPHTPSPEACQRIAEIDFSLRGQSVSSIQLRELEEAVLCREDHDCFRG